MKGGYLRMDKSKIFKRFGACAGVAILSLTLMSGSVFSNTKYFAGEYTVRDAAIKTFDLDTGKKQVLFTEDIFANKERVITDPQAEIANAITMLVDEKIHKVGDHMPIYFLEGNKVSIAIEHADGTISLTDFDISKENPVKIGHIVKEVKQ